MLTFRYFALSFFLLYSAIASCQYVFYIDSIYVTGNRHTKEYVVLSEMDLHPGDTINMENMQSRFEANRKLLQNTSIILDATFIVHQLDTVYKTAQLEVNVKEAWFLYPAPIFELADRNFNVWWVEQKRSINRINIGLKGYHTNLTGNRDRIKALYQTGYTQKMELEYSYPYLNRKKTLGIGVSFLFSSNRELGYNTVNNALLFYKDPDQFLLRRYRGGIGLTYRPNLKSTYNFGLAYQENYVDHYIVEELNSQYFSNGSTSQIYLALFGRYTYDQRDIRPYPEKGYYFNLSVEKYGIGKFSDYKALYVSPTVAVYVKFNKRLFSENNVKIQANLDRSNVPYNQNRALGYTNNYIRGYEYYVIDGTDYIYSKNNLKFKLLDRKINASWIPLRQFQVIPFKCYLTANFDVGYVVDEQFGQTNPLSNTLLTGYGLGLDIVLLYGNVLQLEYSWNGKGENGLFLHGKTNF